MGRHVRILRAGALGLVAVVLLAAMVVGGVGATAPSSTPPTAPSPPPPVPVTVMTRNLYLGADLRPAITATTPEAAQAAVASIFSVARRTNFPERAVALAREIADAGPLLVGLQEVAAWYSGPFGDSAPATAVEYDYLQILLRALAVAGAPYSVVRVQDEADIEGPAGAPFHRDIRLVQRDAILVRAGPGDGVRLDGARSGHFVTKLVVPTATAGVVTVNRGWVAVDATVDGHAFRFVNTHLEAFDPLIRLGQAAELVAPTGPVGSAPGDVVLVGDLNSGPELPVHTNRLAFQALVVAGMTDTWRALHPADPGFTAGYGELLDDPPGPALEHRVDHVMTRGSVGFVDARRSGIDPDDRTAGGLWPSDHAGVITTILP
jgi:hypothetical protein